MDELTKDGLLIRLEPCNKWNETCGYINESPPSDIIEEGSYNKPCNKLLNKRGFKAISYEIDFRKPPLKAEYYCSKHARKLFPNYFK